MKLNNTFERRFNYQPKIPETVIILLLFQFQDRGGLEDDDLDDEDEDDEEDSVSDAFQEEDEPAIQFDDGDTQMAPGSPRNSTLQH